MLFCFVFKTVLIEYNKPSFFSFYTNTHVSPLLQKYFYKRSPVYNFPSEDQKMWFPSSTIPHYLTQQSAVVGSHHLSTFTTLAWPYADYSNYSVIMAT